MDVQMNKILHIFIIKNRVQRYRAFGEQPTTNDKTCNE